MSNQDLSPLSFNVDAVFCISLKHRVDRREAVLIEAKKIAAKVEFILVDKDEEDPQRGCFNSHKKCAKLALARNYNRVLVLEDDVLFEDVSNKKIKRINNFLEDKNPEVFYLGVILGRLWLTWRLGIARARGQGAHAIILSRQACEKIIQLDYVGKGIDSVYSKMFKIYTCFPMLAYQQPEEVFKSDLDDFRGHKAKDQEYWKLVKKKQYSQALKNIAKTILLR